MMYTSSKFADEFLFKVDPTLQYSSLHRIMWSLIANLNKLDNFRVYSILYNGYGAEN